MSRNGMFTANTGLLIASLMWGTIGFGYFTYGWKQKDTPPLLGGLAMMAISYFVSSAWSIWGLGIALVAAVFWTKRHL